MKRFWIFVITFSVCLSIELIVVGVFFSPDPSNYHCMLYIPAAKIIVPVYKNEDAQAAVDADNSAAYIEWRSHGVIVDHREQAFLNLGNVSPNSSLAFLVDRNKPKIYICARRDVGKISKLDGQTTRIYSNDIGQFLAHDDDTIVIYTCSPQDEQDETSILLTYWHRIL